jgi:hypothetical protein
MNSLSFFIYKLFSKSSKKNVNGIFNAIVLGFSEKLARETLNDR